MFTRRQTQPPSAKGLEGMKALGAPASVVAAYEQRGETEDRTFTIAPDNWPAVQLFQRVQTQWRHTGLSGHGSAMLLKTGLDYAGVECTARLCGIELTGADFSRLQILELEALKVMTEEQTKRG